MVIIFCQSDDGRKHSRRSGLRKGKWHMNNYTEEKYRRETRFIHMSTGMSRLSDGDRLDAEKEASKILSSCDPEYKNAGIIDIIQYLTNIADDEKRFAVQIAQLPEGTTGIVLSNKDECILHTDVHNLITINSRLEWEPNFRQRVNMIVGHELGHVLLHFPKHSGKKQHAHRDVEHRYAPEEIQAEYFARCLLMPETTVLDYVSKYLSKNASVQEMAELISRVFDVTMQKAYDRLIIDRIGLHASESTSSVYSHGTSDTPQQIATEGTN